jgi:hypothetical protein
VVKGTGNLTGPATRAILCFKGENAFALEVHFISLSQG